MNCIRSPTRVAAAVVCALFTALAALADPTAAFATTTTGESTPLSLGHRSAAEPAAGGGGGIVRTIVGLAIVIGVIYGLHR
jgi:flagellar protein FliO/FliZ